MLFHWSYITGMSLMLMLGALAACAAYVASAHAALGARERRLQRFDCGHFDLYVGPEFAANVELQAEFLSRQLVAATSSRAA